MNVYPIYFDFLFQVLWYRDTMQLDTTERRIMESRGSRHTLFIRKVHRSDFGNYTCVADNQLGKTRKSVQLTGNETHWLVDINCLFILQFFTQIFQNLFSLCILLHIFLTLYILNLKPENWIVCFQFYPSRIVETR